MLALQLIETEFGMNKFIAQTTLISIASLCFLNATADARVLAEYDAKAAGKGIAPDQVKPAWELQGDGMTNNGKFLLQDTTAANPKTSLGNYTSPQSPGLMKWHSGEYGIEFRARPLTDMPNLGYSHYANLMVTWSDEKFSYNVSLDLDEDDEMHGRAGALRCGQNTMLAVVHDVEWSQPRTIFVGYRGAADEFDFYVDGKKAKTIAGSEIARDHFPGGQDRVAFGDFTTGQPAPKSIDLAAEWYYIRLHDTADPVKAEKERAAKPRSEATPAAPPALVADVPWKGIALYGGICAHEETCTEQTIIESIAKYKANGIPAVLPSLCGPGTVYWKTDKMEYTPLLKAKLDSGFDALAVFIQHAHAAGIKVLPSIAIGHARRITDGHPEWETHDRLGRPSSTTTAESLAFSYPAARQAKIAVLMDLVNNYDVDGVLLDYCRYPENTATREAAYGFYGYDEPLIQACQQIYGFDPRQEPIDSERWKIFNSMRAESVTTFVREFREAVQRSGRKIRIGGFGDTNPDLEARSCGRDYAAWAQRGLIDDFYLGCYITPIREMTEAVKRVRRAIGPNTVLHSSLSPFKAFQKTNEEMVEAAKAQLAGGADGLWIYREDFLEQLNLWDGAKSARDLLVTARVAP